MIVKKGPQHNDGQAKKGLGRGLSSLLDDNSPSVTVERPKVVVRKDDHRNTNTKEGTDNGKKRTRS